MSTRTDAERLAATRDNYLTQLEELSDPLRRKVSYSLGGRGVSWTEYQRFLLDMLKSLDDYAASSGGDAVLVTKVR